jgi:hypothetical protein
MRGCRTIHISGSDALLAGDWNNAEELLPGPRSLDARRGLSAIRRIYASAGI